LSALPRAIYLAIGTELTSGQITNRNASWISSQLEALGIPVLWHLCVPDDRALMRKAMEFAALQGNLIFITGGLGPTSDDFTRDVVAEWWGAKMQWNEPTWSKAVERLARRGITAPESGKQQCWYPEGSVVLSNREGTADGFFLERLGCAVFVLPGPPREIEAIWLDHIAGWMTSRYGQLRSMEPLRWSVLGRSESQLADLVEEAVRGSGLQTGYRAHPPYVEVKIWISPPLSQDEPKVVAALARLEAAIGQWTVARGDEDVADLFFGLEGFGSGLPELSAPLEWVDACTPGYLAERISCWGRSSPERMKRLQNLTTSVRTCFAPEERSLNSPSEGVKGTRITLGPLVPSGLKGESARAKVQFEHADGRSFAREIEVPLPASMPERQWLLVVEKLLARLFDAALK
jgi:molybdenum cofactor synthesis domain-containing protein